jgi:2-polyprenyl-3-methyl-5-hydroxy-6-metoxy-1,4-benzoquinol methylase
MSTQPTLDPAKARAFAFKTLGDITSAQMDLLNLIADRLGLWRILAAAGPVTCAEFAELAEIDERYAREWLAAMACHGTLDYDAASERFTLPPEHAHVLADHDSPLYLGSYPSMHQAIWGNADLLIASFRRGGGVPQDRYGDNFWCAFERFSQAAFKNNLVQDWLPALPQADAALRAGGAVADVGCGNGQALLVLARGYPNATLVGYDSYQPAIAAAIANAEAAGLADRVRYEVCDASRGLPGQYDLITTFDVVHDMPHPRPALKAIRQALKPGGTYFVLEPNFSSDLRQNIEHPLGLGAFGYSASVGYCLTQALAARGEGTGTCLGEANLRALATEAGFAHFRRLDFPNNPFSLCYELRD